LWFDESLAGGQAWWNVIVQEIGASDIVVAAVSPALLRSEACIIELDYARRLNKPLLPVVVAPLDPALLPPELASIQLVEFGEDQQSAFRLAAAVADMLRRPASPPPADPQVPPPPMSYLTTLADRIRSDLLGLDEQLALVARLERAVEKGEDLRTIGSLVQSFAGREDLYHQVGMRLDRLEQILRSAEQGSAGGDLHRGGPRRTATIDEVGRSAIVYRVGLVKHGKQSRTLRVTGRTITCDIHVKISTSTSIYIDGEKVVPVEQRVGPRAEVYRFWVQLDENEPTLCELRRAGYFTIKGLLLRIDDKDVYREGSLHR
jgi:hypothetical protein